MKSQALTLLAAGAILLAGGASAQTAQEFSIPTPDSVPVSITNGPDGNLWFTESRANRIGRIAPGGSFVEYPLALAASGPWQIVAGPDAALWFTERTGGRIGRITTDGVISEISVPAPSAEPFGIAVGPDGNLWFTERRGNAVVRLELDGRFTEFPLPDAGSQPAWITAGPDGALWFTEQAGQRVGRITTDGSLEEFPSGSDGRYPFGIAAAPDGNVWFTQIPGAGGSATRMRPDGSATDFPLPPYTPWQIAPGPDGRMWFTESDGHVGRIEPNGATTLLAVPTPGANPFGLVTGPDGGIWFTELGANRIGRLDPAQACPAPPAPLLTVDGVEGIRVAPGDVFTLSWTSTLAGDLGAYELFVSRDGGTTFQAAAETDRTSLTTSAADSDAGITLVFAVEAARSCPGALAESAASAPVRVEVAGTAAAGCGAPRGTGAFPCLEPPTKPAPAPVEGRR
jgi:virginiamycin B lyase